MLTLRQKKNIVKKFQLNKTDTGSAPVQIAVLTREIKELTKHLKKHKKDNHSRRGLLGKVNKRRKLLKYLKNKDEKQYKKLIKSLGLKK